LRLQVTLLRSGEEPRACIPTATRGCYERIQGLIDKGNDLRRRFGHSVLADLAISRIAKSREQVKVAAQQARYTGRRICYIVDSIKNSDELDILRLVYREMFYFLGVFAPVHVRQKELEAEGMTLEQVYKIIDRNSGEDIESVPALEGIVVKSLVSRKLLEA
jgi:hypothetical protein